MVSIFAKAFICRGNTQIHLQFFLQIKTLVDTERSSELRRKWIAQVLQVKLRFMGCLVKANALVIENSNVDIIASLSCCHRYHY